jgi:hypothetical protein
VTTPEIKVLNSSMSYKYYNPKFGVFAGRQWLPPVILATQEAEIRKIMVHG